MHAVFRGFNYDAALIASGHRDSVTSGAHRNAKIRTGYALSDQAVIDPYGRNTAPQIGAVEIDD